MDGAAAAFTPDGALLLEAGQHVLNFHAPSYADREHRLDVRGGERETLRITMEPLALSLALARPRRRVR